MSRDELDQFYKFASQRIARGERHESLEAALTYWRTQAITGEWVPFPEGQTLAERLTISGVLGSSSTGPPDLSTNPAYMEGFGES